MVDGRFLWGDQMENIAQLEKELSELISYDEQLTDEGKKVKVDYYWTALNLLKAGYRKVC